MTAISDRILERLGNKDSEILREGVILAVDHALAQKLDTVLDRDAAVDLVVDLVAGENVARLLERHANPARRRLRAHFRETQETVNQLVPDETVERVEAILRNGDHPRLGWASGAIKREHVKTLLSPVIQEILLAFVRKLPIPGASGDSDGGGSSKKRRGFGLGSSIMDIGKGMLGDLQQRFQETAREFSSQAMSDAKDAALQQLTSDEGRRTIRAMRDALIDQFMHAKVIDLIDDVERLPLENLLDLLPAIANHNRTRDEFRLFVRGEVHAILETEGERPIQELLEENGLLNPVRDRIIDEAIRQTSELFQTNAARSWIEKLVAK